MYARLRNLSGRPPAKGMKLPTVAWYFHLNKIPPHHEYAQRHVL